MKTLQSLSPFISTFERVCIDKSPIGVFDDFLTLCMNIITKRPNTKLPYYEAEYERIADSYKKTNTYEDFLMLPSIAFNMINEKAVEPDILGDFCRSLIGCDAYCTSSSPFALCLEMTQVFSAEPARPAFVFDTAAGSGRMLIALSANSVFKHKYLAVNTHPVLTKLAAINMYMYKMQGEAICADGHNPEYFRVGYKVCFEPNGVFRIDVREKSLLWHMNRDIFADMRRKNPEKRMLFF